MTYIVLEKKENGETLCQEVETGKVVVFAAGVEVPEEVGETFFIDKD